MVLRKIPALVFMSLYEHPGRAALQQTIVLSSVRLRIVA